MMEKQKRKPLDMLHGSIWYKLPVFAFPVAATAILEQLFNASDIAVVGNFTGDGKTIAVAAVGANSSIISLIVNLFVGIALGANVVIANAIGRKDKEAVTKAVHTSIIIALLAGTGVSIAVSSVLLFYRLVKTKELIHVEWKELKIDRKILGQIMKIGLPAGIQSAVFAIANIVIQSAINSLGTVVMAASSAAYNIEIFAYDILNSFSQACTTFVGQNYGAGQLRRCRKILILCIVEDAANRLRSIPHDGSGRM